MRHRMRSIDWDMDGEWDGVVKWDSRTRQFVRYLDRNGEHWEPVALQWVSIILPLHFYGLVTER